MIACGEPTPTAPTAPAPIARVAVPVDGPVDAAEVVAIDAAVTLEQALAELRAVGFDRAAASIERRAAQAKPKLKLTPDEARVAAIATLELAKRPRFVALQLVMPRSTVELARATALRGVSIADAEAIAAYLVQLVDAVDFGKLETFDENHSHVTGRDWPQIDYTGEGMTWQSQQAYWAPRGVTSFKTAAFVHAYMIGAEKLEHWKRVYAPRNRIPSTLAP